MLDSDQTSTPERAKTSSRELTDWDRDHVWHSFTQMKHYTPFVVAAAEGARITDVDGNEYIDAVSSLWCNVHGHRHPMLDAALKQQVDRVAHVTNLGGSNDQTIQLARLLAELTPGDLKHVFFCSDGANSIEVALKMAFQYWQQCHHPEPQRVKYVCLSDAYHGDTIGTVSLGDIPLFHKIFKPLLFEPIRVPAPDAFEPSFPESSTGGLDDGLKNLELVLQQHSGEIAAIVAEPLVQGAAGIKIHPEGYLKGVADLAKRYDVLLIADEVAVGFGRTGTLFACEQESVDPDILCLGKGLSGGYLPISAAVATPKIYEAFWGDYSERKALYHGHTFAGNPLACAVSIANLQVFKKEKTLENLVPKISRMAERLERLNQSDFAEKTRQKGMMAAFDLKVPAGKNETEYGYYFCELVQQYGVRMRPLGKTIIVMPPLSITLDELDVIFDAIDMVL